MKRLSYYVIVVALLCACNDDVDHKRVLMKDGSVIYLENEKVTHYETEDALTAGYDEYVFSRAEVNEVSQVRVDSVYGYSVIMENASWQIATFGQWVSEYGAVPNQKYYVRMVEVQKDLPCYSGEQISPAKYRGDDIQMGYVSSDDRGFMVSSQRTADGYFLGRTLMTHIAYDEDGNSVNTFYPVNDLSTLKWKYGLLTIDWGDDSPW